MCQQNGKIYIRLFFRWKKKFPFECYLSLIYIYSELSLTIVNSKYILRFSIHTFPGCSRVTTGDDIYSCITRVATGDDIYSCITRVATGDDIYSCITRVATGDDNLSIHA